MRNLGDLVIFGCVSAMRICFRIVDRVQLTTITDPPKTGAPPGPFVPKMTTCGHF